MILVLLGTHELQFSRILKMVESCIEADVINEPVIAQVGNTRYASNTMEIIDYLGYNEMENLIGQAAFIICHGGTGSIITSLRAHKKLIAVPRLKRYGEHNDDHQVEILNKLEEEGYILVCNDGERLSEKIVELPSFKPKPFQSDNTLMLNTLRNFLTY